MRNKTDPCGPHMKGDGSWWAYDAAGIELCRVCEKCEEVKLSGYNQDIFSNPHYAATGDEEWLWLDIDS